MAVKRKRAKSAHATAVAVEQEAASLLRETPFIRKKLLAFAIRLLRAQRLPCSDSDLHQFLYFVLPRHRVVRLLEKVGRSLKCTQWFKSEPPDREHRAERARRIAEELWGSRKTRRQFTSQLVIEMEREASRFGINGVSAAQGAEKHFLELAGFYDLSTQELDILILTYLAHNELIDPFNYHGLHGHESLADRLVVIATATGIPHGLCAKFLTSSATLRRCELLDADASFNKKLDAYLSGIDAEPLASKHFVRHEEAPLPWNMHGKLAENHGVWLKKLLSVRDRARGFHILLYGEPGTGKTSFAASLAAALGLDLYRVKKGDESRSQMENDSRMTSVYLCAKRVNPERSLILIDEADRMLQSHGDTLAAMAGGGIIGDKGALNTLLDQVKVPCIWITNTAPHALDASTRRRFDYSIAFKRFDRSQRLQVWQHAAKRYGVEQHLPAELMTQLAEQYAVNAGGIDVALRNCAPLWQACPPTSQEAQKQLHHLLKAHCQLMEITTGLHSDSLAADYTLDGLNIVSDVSLDEVTQAIRTYRLELESEEIAQADTPRMNILLHGPPGSGKTEYVKYLAKQLDCPLHVRRASDFLDMYVGGTEQNVRRAARRAEQDHAILFIDEAEALFMNRERAVRSWEISQVTELLQMMENFRGILICATNRFADMDAATVRRFIFKVGFDHLTPAGKLHFYERTLYRLFDRPMTDGDRKKLAAIDRLTPGDFRTVRQRLHYLAREKVGHDQLLAALAEESAAKQQRAVGSANFGFLRRSA